MSSTTRSLIDTKVDTLASRFIDSPYHNPIQLPHDMTVGFTASNGDALDGDGLTSEFNKPFFSMTSILLSIDSPFDQAWVISVCLVEFKWRILSCYEKICLASITEDYDTIEIYAKWINKIANRMYDLSVLLFEIYRNLIYIKKEYKYSQLRMDRLKLMLRDVMVTERKKERKVEEYELLKLMKNLGLELYNCSSRNYANIEWTNELLLDLPRLSRINDVAECACIGLQNLRVANYLYGEGRCRHAKRKSGLEHMNLLPIYSGEQKEKFDFKMERLLDYRRSLRIEGGRYIDMVESNGIPEGMVNCLHKYHSRINDMINLGETVHSELRKIWSLYIHANKRLKRYYMQNKSSFSKFPDVKPNLPYVILNFIGSGGFAEVWESLDLEKGELKAIKITELSKPFSNEMQHSIIELTSREVTLQRLLKHPYIVEMERCFNVTSHTFVAVMELCDGYDLDRYIQIYGPIPEALARIWMSQIASALHYLHHSVNVVHFDLKPHNILIHKGIVKISDFGLHQTMPESGKLELDMRNELNHLGTVWYMPPEHLNAALARTMSSVDYTYDCWAMGMIFYEMLYQRRPFGLKADANGARFDRVAEQIIKDFKQFQARPEIIFPNYREISIECREFLLHLLCPVESRWASEKILKCDYLQIDV